MLDLQTGDGAMIENLPTPPEIDGRDRRLPT